MPSVVSFVALLPLGLTVLLLAIALVRRASPARADTRRAVLLFEGETLVDTAGIADRDDDLSGIAGTGLAAVVVALGAHFPDLAARLVETARASVMLDGAGSGDRLMVERWGDFTRLTLDSEPAPGAALRSTSLEAELQVLRGILDDSPQPVWRKDATGRVVWANRAYLDLADRLSPPPADGAPVWPLQPILGAGGADARAALALPGEDEPRWFDILPVRRGDITTVFATDVTRIVAAEESRRAIVQAMTRTFAHLRTGLVVFDRRRRLVLFNPAFVDLTGLRPDFLARCPHVRSILDRLREARVLPEPANWAGWRNRVATLQVSAEQGSYCENWQLPDGRTLRVTGRPHPDGALAFFIEDISDDMALSRHQRRGLELGQAALDRLPEAIAVFSETGSLMFCNAAYARRWGVLLGQPQDLPLAGALAGWRDACLPAPFWSRLAGMIAPGGTLDDTDEELAFIDGTMQRLHLAPLGGGCVMAVFRAIDLGDAHIAANVVPMHAGRVKTVAAGGPEYASGGVHRGL